jgi:hypothetical protein
MKFGVVIVLLLSLNCSLAIKCFKCESSEPACEHLTNNGEGLEVQCNHTDYCVLKYSRGEVFFKDNISLIINFNFQMNKMSMT